MAARGRSAIRWTAAVVLLLAGGVLAPSARATTYDGVVPLVANVPDSASFRSWWMAPDGRWAVVLADLEVDDRFDLYAVRLDAPPADPVRLSPASTAGDFARGQVAISPDSQWVVYSGDLTNGGVDEVFSVPIDGSAPAIRITAPTSVARTFVSDVRISPDSRTVVIRGNLTDETIQELYAAPIAESGGMVRLHAPIAVHGRALDREITSDSSRIVFASGRSLYSAPLDGSGADVLTRLHPEPGDGERGVFDDRVNFEYLGMALAPDASRVVYRAGFGDPGRPELFSAAVDGSDADELIRLNNDVVELGEVFTFKIAPDSSRVLFTGDLDVNGPFRLWSAPLDGSAPAVRLDEPAPGDEPRGDVRWYEITRDATRVAFATVPEGDLYVAPVDGSATAALLAAPPIPDSVHILEQTLTPDSTRLLFMGDVLGDDTLQIAVVPLDASEPPTVLVHADHGVRLGNSTAFLDAPVGFPRATFRAVRRDEPGSAFYTVPLDGSSPPLALADPGMVDVVRVLPAPDGSFLLVGARASPGATYQPWLTSRGLPPAPPTDVAVAATTPTAVTVSWTASAGSDVTSHGVTVTPVGSQPTSETTAPAGATSMVVDGLRPGTDHEVVVRAHNVVGATSSTPVRFATLPERGVTRIAGSTRFDTAARLALGADARPQVVYLAVGDNFPDALAGGPLAAHEGAPILLVRTDALPPDTEAALASLAPERVVALGGTAAISDAVLAAAGTAAGATTDRIAGPDRYATAAAIAQRMPPSTTVHLATGTNFPDALAAGPATGGAPILLVTRDAVPAATAAALETLDPDAVVVLGGPGVISEETAQAAATAGTAYLAFVSGPDRYATAVAVARNRPGPTHPETVYVAVGSNFPDALAASTRVAADEAVLVLSRRDALPDVVRDYLDGLPSLRRIVVLGGSAAIDPALETVLAALLDG